MCGRYPVNPGLDSLVPEPALQHKFAWLLGHLVDHAANFATAGLKSLFHKLETYGGQCLQIPVFTGMTGFGAALRVVGKNDVANRRAVYGPTLERGLLKQALKPAATMECSSWPESTLNPGRGLVTASQARVGAVPVHFTGRRLEISRRRWR